MLKKVTVRIKSGGIFQLPLNQKEIDRLIVLCANKEENVQMFDINTLITSEKRSKDTYIERKIDKEMWIRLSEIDCIMVEPMSNLSVPPQKDIIIPKSGA